MAGLFNIALKKNIGPDYISQKHFDNPNKSNIYAIICNDEGKTIGANYFIVSIYRFGEKEYLGALACDYMVHPNYQRQGISTQMTEKAEGALKEIDIDFLLTFPNEKSLPSFIRNGWQEVISFDYYYKVACLPQWLLDLTFWRQEKKALKATDRKMTVYLQTIQEYAETIIKDDANRIGLKLTYKILNWKFTQNKRKTRCLTVFDEHTKEPVFSCAFIDDIRKVKGIKITFQDIIDWHFYDDDSSAGRKAMALAMKEIKRHGDFIIVWQPFEKDVYKMLTEDFKFHNISKLNMGKHSHPFLVKPINAELVGFIEDANNWKMRWIEADL